MTHPISRFVAPYAKGRSHILRFDVESRYKPARTRARTKDKDRPPRLSLAISSQLRIGYRLLIGNAKSTLTLIRLSIRRPSNLARPNGSGVNNHSLTIDRINTEVWLCVCARIQTRTNYKNIISPIVFFCNCNFYAIDYSMIFTVFRKLK